VNVLSLFDGISCGQVALNRIGITPSEYYASELDEYAIKVTQANYPNTVQLGDVTKWREWNLDWSSIDLLIGGSPCQGFSFAGKQLAFDDPRSALFFVYVDILNHIKAVNPRVKFMLENVRMKKEYLEIISGILEVEPVLINSSLVSAQNRQRFYWANWTIKQPEDKRIFLKDILEDEPFEKTIMSDKFTTRNAHILRDDFDGKAKSLSAMEYVKNGRQGDYIKFGQMVGRKINPETGKRDDYNKELKATQRIEIRSDDKTGAITTVQKDNLIIQTPRGNNSGGFRALDGKTPTLSANSWEHNNKLVLRDKSKCVRSSGRGSYDRHEWDSISNCHYRKLTPIECERLQTVPDNYTNHVSNTQRYKMLGNGWTVDVVAHIFKQGQLYEEPN